MDGLGTTWWLGADRKWREGPPPAGWYQGTDGRWHPPDAPRPEAVAAAEAPTERITIEPPPRPGTRGQPESLYGRYLAIPQWTRVAMGAGIATVVLAAAAVLTIKSGGSGGDSADPPDGGPPTTVAPAGHTPTSAGDPSSAPSSSSSEQPATTTTEDEATTTTARRGPTTTEAPPSNDPLALCSPGQRSMIERGTHPQSWYIEHFDPDHNGVFCE